MEIYLEVSMKKIFLALVIAFVFTAAVSAQTYTVQSVTGRVEREAGNQRVAVKAGDTLNADTVIHTGVASSLVLKSGSDSFNVPAMQNGKVSSLVTAAAGVRISGNIARVDTGEAARVTGQVSTASARASDSAQDKDIAAE
jgi:hypothetical protein